eukprot:8447703-Alexandrium_andersonii.AAC.1
MFVAQPYKDVAQQTPERCLPIKLHGDDAEGFTSMSRSSVFVRGLKRMLIAVEDLDNAHPLCRGTVWE